MTKLVLFSDLIHGENNETDLRLLGLFEHANPSIGSSLRVPI